MLLDLFWKRANASGALFGVTFGTVFAMLLGFGAPAPAQKYETLSFLDMHWLYLGFFAQVIITIGIIIVSLLTPAIPNQTGDYQWRLSLLTAYDDGTGKKRPLYKSLVLWFAILYTTIGCIYWYFW